MHLMIPSLFLVCCCIHTQHPVVAPRLAFALAQVPGCGLGAVLSCLLKKAKATQRSAVCGCVIPRLTTGKRVTLCTSVIAVGEWG